MDNIPEHLKPAWWDAYVEYADSLECGPDGFDAEIHRDGFAAGWTLGQEADHGAAARLGALEAALAWYADPENYDTVELYSDDPRLHARGVTNRHRPILDDEGKRAREALDSAATSSEEPD